MPSHEPSEGPGDGTPPTAMRVAGIRREHVAVRMVRWRIRLLAYGFAQLVIVELLVIIFLPGGARRLSLELICVAFVFLGAAPVLVSLVQYSLVGFHRFRIHYARLKPYYPRTAVVVPAWNEAAVIGATIDHLLSIEYPEDRLRICVVDDASTDETPHVIQRKMAEHPGRIVHVRRTLGGQGKSHTLNAGINHILADDWAQAILIIDADVLFEKAALRKMTRHLSDPGVGAVMAYIKEGSSDPNYLNRFIAYEYITAQPAARRSQNILGATACLAGGAQLHSRDNLLAIGGRVDTSTFAEDTVTTFRTQLAGNRVVFEGNATVWAEEPPDVSALWKQRLRWGRGNVEVSLQFASVWGHGLRFGRLGQIPFNLIWFTVLLMPMLMFASATGLVALYFIGGATAWHVFHVLWIWNVVAFVFGTLMSFMLDPATARRCWLQGLVFPGLISLAIMVYTVYPPLYDVDAVHALQRFGIVVTPGVQELLTLFMYSWLFLCIPIAYIAKVLSDTPGCRWLVPVIIYIGGYGPLLCAITFASYVKEILNVDAVWDKTVKLGRAVMPT